MISSLVVDNSFNDESHLGSLILVVENSLGVRLIGKTDAIMRGDMSVEQKEGIIFITFSAPLNQPLIIRYQSSSEQPVFKAPDIRVTIKNGISGSLVEYFDLNVDDSKVSGVTSLVLEKNSTLNYLRYSNLEKNDSSEHALNAQIHEAATLKFFDIHPTFGSANSKNTILLKEKNASVYFYGLDELKAGASNKNHLTIVHEAPSTKSEQCFRGLYFDESKGEFFGRVVVEKEAQSSDAQQLYRAVVVDKSAKATVLPQLEVNNEEISASHGASIGELDTNALFYLQSRGISLNDAKSLLLFSLAQDVIKNIDDLKLRDEVLKKLRCAPKKEEQVAHV